MADYFSFEDVMKELELSEEDLKRMVSEGELRAFRDENKMKFKMEDVENLKKGRITEPTIILPSTPGSQQDETVLDLDIGQEQAKLSSETAEAKPVPQRGRKPEEETSDELTLQPVEEDNPAETDETFIEEEADTGLTTEPLKLADEVEAAETVESGEAVTEEVVETAQRRPRRTMRQRVGAVPLATEEEIERRRAHPVWTVFTILAFVVALYSGVFVYDLLMIENGRAEQPSGMTAGLAEWTLTQFWGDGQWRGFHEKEYPGNRQPPFKISEKDLDPPEPWYTGPSFKTRPRPLPLFQTQ